MTSAQGYTQTEEREDHKTYQSRVAPRFIRFLRADDPFDDVASYELPRHASCRLGRADRRPSSASPPGSISTYGDTRMSVRHALLSDTGAGWQISDLDSKNGTWVNGRRISSPHVLRHGDIVECGRSFFLFRQTAREPLSTHFPLGAALDVPPFCYQIASFCTHLGSSAAIHLHGETGTGKEVVARALHTLSKRPGNFVGINCAAIPETLFESEMFGFRKGAFSGAAEDQRGAILAADRGTLFLDEIGELPLPMQAKLLRVLELKEVLRIGTSTPVPVDFRLVSATLCDLKTMVAAGRFRRDLYARLGHAFTVPPLRDHKEELGRVVQSCLASILAEARAAGRPQLKFQFTLSAARMLVHYDWPSNIREVKQCMEHAFAAAQSDVQSGSGPCRIDGHHLPAAIRSAWGECSAITVESGIALGPETIDEREEGPSDSDIVEALKETQGNRNQAARVLGITERTMYRRLKRLREIIAGRESLPLS